MKVTACTPISAVYVETDQDEYNEYTRYSDGCWFVRMGESDEPVYDCEELEIAYQNYLKRSVEGWR